ncbi:hypothetical protein AVEN_77243-1 [Araneus ventricosus]|uniref:Uncharacterized protein n=1 Tax=Araneus ventricosus TaxID=182803 RepID=A0A4Y2H1H5_ARAVE|nr:hypothetical protein AVEN_255115-1 [Araneus ventricosus]GBM58714.1 hypothetical protein AVEN_254959-1 [Araneus ventricosus]GBM58763.1 hypothetical protein AVEN_188650-1 [Araneus ventricosus]GBM58806.1 hypothetical protein AVEN_77243-1 [Araneus ventricosus]
MFILLGETPERGINWLKPGTTHHARWMQSILSPAKMFAFSAQAGYDKDMISKLEALCKFNALFYVKNRLSSSIVADAPYNDLKLWHDLNKYCSMGIGAEWLEKPVSEWYNDPNYQEAETYVRHVKVVNDMSEKAVKLIQDFSTSVTNDETQKQFL